MSLPLDDLTLFIAGSAALLWMSRKTLRNAKSHGFYRFFAGELILLLMVMNRTPLGDQTIADALLNISGALVVLGYVSLRRFGNASTIRNDDALLGFERTTTLVTNSIFRYIRHPMYSSLMALAWGFFFRVPSTMAMSLAGLASFLLFQTALADERECVAYFGQVYADYMQRTRRFVPYLF